MSKRNERRNARRTSHHAHHPSLVVSDETRTLCVKLLLSNKQTKFNRASAIGFDNMEASEILFEGAYLGIAAAAVTNDPGERKVCYAQAVSLLILAGASETIIRPFAALAANNKATIDENVQDMIDQVAGRLRMSVALEPEPEGALPS